jgi:hypothetical protein
MLLALFKVRFVENYVRRAQATCFPTACWLQLHGVHLQPLQMIYRQHVFDQRSNRNKLACCCTE